MTEIPPNATIRQEYVKCGNPDCQNSHGPYLYAYWKQNKKLKKLYVGKNLEDFRLRKLAKEIKLRPSQLIKLKFIEHIGDIIAYQHGLHFCQEVYPYRNQNKVSSNT
jgi:hypothetical protein